SSTRSWGTFIASKSEAWSCVKCGSRDSSRSIDKPATSIPCSTAVRSSSCTVSAARCILAESASPWTARLGRCSEKRRSPNTSFVFPLARQRLFEMADDSPQIVFYKRARFKTNLPTDRLYVQSHYWLAEESPGTFRIGLTKFATRMLGD